MAFRAQLRLLDSTVCERPLSAELSPINQWVKHEINCGHRRGVLGKEPGP